MKRNLQGELMDQPCLNPALHAQALAGLRRINWVSRSVAIVWRSIAQAASRAGTRRLRVLDLASGGGDVALGVAQRARRQGLSIDVHGCDVSPVAVETAQELAIHRGLSEDVRFFTLDVVQQPLPEGYDVLMCSLFLHHLADHTAVDLLRKMADATTDVVLVSDLRRSRVGYAMAWVAGRALTRSEIVHVDSLRSVAAAFTMKEATTLAEAAGLQGASIVRHWPQRFLLTWRKV